METEDDFARASIQRTVPANGAPLPEAVRAGKLGLWGEKTGAPPAPTQRKKSIQQLVVELVKERGAMSSSELAEALDCTAKQAADACCHLRRAGILKRTTEQMGAPVEMATAVTVPAPPTPAPLCERAAKTPPTPPAERPEKRLALYGDGTFIIENGPQRLEFNVEELAQLHQFAGMALTWHRQRNDEPTTGALS